MTPPLVESWWNAARRERLLGRRTRTSTEPRSFTRNGRSGTFAVAGAGGSKRAEDEISSGIACNKVWQSRHIWRSYQRTRRWIVSSIARQRKDFSQSGEASP